MGARRGIDWAAVEDLGRVTDATIARRLGVDHTAVTHARRRLGVPAYGAHRFRRVCIPPDLVEVLELDAADLGMTLDELVVGALREQFGVGAP